MIDKSKHSYSKCMKMHMNGGKKFSAMIWDIHRDGVAIGVNLTDETSGSPDYRYTARTLRHGDQTFDVLAHGMAAGIAWLDQITLTADAPGDDDAA